MKRKNIFVWIMAGGAGERFWPWSRELKPKQFLPVIGDKPLLRITFERALRITDKEKIFVGTGVNLEKEVRNILSELPVENIITEPIRRNNSAPLCMTAHIIIKRDINARMLVLPSDHFISDEEKFTETILSASDFLEKNHFLITFGIKPTYPETGYGYIKRGKLLFESSSGNRIFEGVSFTEKPDDRKAMDYLLSEEYYWNSGIFFWRVEDILAEFYVYQNEIYQAMEIYAEQKISKRNVDDTLFINMPDISVDYAIMEKAKKIAVVEASFDWNDIGSWRSLDKIYPLDENKNLILGECLVFDGKNNIVKNESGLLVTLGLSDVVVVKMGDVVLAIPKEKAQDVKKIINYLRKTSWGYKFL